MFRSRFFRSVPWLLAAGLLASCAGPAPTPGEAAAGTPHGAAAPLPKPSRVESLVAGMTLEQKVGQTMVIGFDGPAYDPGVRRMIERNHVGGVIFFARNIESPAQVARIANEMQASAQTAGGIGLFVATDQEGGRVARLTAGKGFTEFPGAMAIGASARDLAGAAANARRVAAAMAAEMRAIGINTDFAPDLDVNNNPRNPVIGVRSFSSDPARVAALGVGFIGGLQAGGVLAFGKHFPGHGDTGTDSHLNLPVVGHARPRLEAVEFVPFRAAISADVAGIMTAHVAFPAIEPSGLPGTLSPKALTGLLRRELHFDGLVVTDSLEMGALAQSGHPAPQAAAEALKAGADLLLFNRDHPIHQAAFDRIVADVRSGVIPLARLDEAVRRILRAKERFGLLQPPPVDPARAALVCGAKEHQALATEIASNSITLVRDDAGQLPLRPGRKPLVIAVPAAAGLAAALDALEVRVSEAAPAAEVSAAVKAIRAHPGATVILTLAGAATNRNQAALATAVIETGAPVVVIALREPYELLGLGTGPHAPSLLATYGFNPPTLRALVDVLRGERKPAGHLPVDLPGFLPVGAGLTEFSGR